MYMTGLKDEMVCLNLHVGNNIGYSTIHPIFVRMVVQAIKDGGGKPFIVDVVGMGRAVNSAAIQPKFWVPGLSYRPDPRKLLLYSRAEYKNLKTWKVAGMFRKLLLVNFAQSKAIQPRLRRSVQERSPGWMVGENAVTDCTMLTLRKSRFKKIVPTCG